MLLPEQYIGLAEREGLVTAIDNMLLLRCIQLLRKVQRKKPKLGFFCNVSPRTLGDEDFFGDFLGFLEQNDELAPNLVFEFAQGDFARHGKTENRHIDRLAMLLTGYLRGLVDRPAVVSTLLLIFTYATVFTLVLDLDRPAKGIFSVSQQPMIELRDSLHGQ